MNNEVITNKEDIKIGKRYFISDDFGDQYILIKSINTSKDIYTDKKEIKMFENSLYLNIGLDDEMRIDLFDMEVIEMTDEMKVQWCKNNCCGCDYCSGFKEDGSKCKYAPSNEAIKDEIMKCS